MTTPPSDAPVHSLAARKAVVLALAVPVLVAFTAILLQYKGLIDVGSFGLAENYLDGPGFAVIVISLVPIFDIWRCPGCRAYLGKEISPERCPSCGARFR